MSRKKTTKEFIEEARLKHGDRYDYSEAIYTGASKKLKIICATHGIFEQIARKHTSGQNCAKCSNAIYRNTKKTIKEFIKEAILKHGDQYDYSKVAYVNNRTNIIITCPIHGDFGQTPTSHIAGMGCKECGYLYSANLRKKTNNEFIEDAKLVHGDKYDYSEVQYVNSKTHIIITCPTHGDFEQIPSSHLCGKGCKECGYLYSVNLRRKTNNEFIEDAKLVHGDKYGYSEVQYVDAKQKIIITCPQHGQFYQIPNDHLCGKGCSLCTKGKSQPESDIINYIKSLGFEVNQGDRSILGGRELDIVIPSKKVAIEYNGLEFHREGLCKKWVGGKDKQYHLQKTLGAKEQGYKLIHIFEDEWLYQKELVKSKLAHILGVSNSKRIYARKCVVKQITLSEAKELMNRNHIQGTDNSNIVWGAFYNDKLVAVMTFLRTKNKGVYKLNRFATDTNYHVIGIASKLLKAFERKFEPLEIYTYSDRRWTSSHNNVYSSIGFDFTGSTKPGYFYYKVGGNYERLSRQKFMKHKLLKKYPQYDKSWKEKDIMADLGYDRIWDCGHYKYIKTY